MVGSFWRSAPAAELRGFTKRRSPALGLALVHGCEFLDGHVDLAADLEHVGIGPAAGARSLGTSFTVRDVRRHVLAGHAVAPGGRLDEACPLVDQGHGDAVHLGLAREGERVQVEVGQPAGAAARPTPAAPRR